MAKHLLTEKEMQNLKPRKTPYADGGGVYWQVTAGKNDRINVSALFKFSDGIKISKAGKPYKAVAWMGLGAYGTKIGKTWHVELSMKDIRDRGDAARELHNQGVNPLKHRERQKAAAKAEAAKAMTFDACRDAYVADREKGWGSEHRSDWINSMERYVTPVFGTLPVAAVDTPLVLKVLRPIWDSKYPTARVVRERIHAVLDWSIAGGYRAGPNPATWQGHLDKLLREPDHVVEHHPAMPYQEVFGLVSDLEKRSDRDSLCLLLLIYTVMRVGAAAGARAEEFDLVKKVWTIPASRMKRRGKRKHIGFRVPLSDAAISVITRVGVTSGPLFPSADHTSLAKAHGREDITNHGFRSTFRDWAADCTPFPREVAEMAMSHVCIGDTEEAYFRSDLLERRRLLLNRWAEFCSEPWVEPNVDDNIVPFQKSA